MDGSCVDERDYDNGEPTVNSGKFGSRDLEVIGLVSTYVGTYAKATRVLEYLGFRDLI